MNLYADLLFQGSVYTADPTMPWAEAVAVRDGRILAVGSASDLAELRGPATEMVSLNGRLLVPGFTDSHIHFVEVAFRAAQVDLTGTTSPLQVAEIVRVWAASLQKLDEGLTSGGWLQGGGWDASVWPEGEGPHRDCLDTVAPDRPVALFRKDLHSVWLNTAGLARAGITADTPDVPGGVIDRDTSGELTGILHENAMGLLDRCIPAPDLAETIAAVRAATPALWAAGIVAIHNANDTSDGLALRTYQTLHHNGELGVRVLQQIPVGSLSHALGLGLQSGLGDAWLRIGGVKVFADGSLGSRTASMLQPFEGEPRNWGVPTMDPEELLERALAVSAGGLSLTIHAIGDRANRDVLDVLAEVRRREAHTRVLPPGLRHRIEHVQCIDPADLPRLAQLGIIASVQPIHATSDMLMVDRHWGLKRARGAYAFRSLLDSGARLVFGSDAPVETPSPLAGIHAAVTRRRADGTPGPNGRQGQERISVAEAVDAYTRWPAYAAGEESYRGSITPGNVADLTLLSRDIFTVEPMQILDTEVEMTVLNGRIVYRRG